jgi:hypothetical protein
MNNKLVGLLLTEQSYPRLVPIIAADRGSVGLPVPPILRRGGKTLPWVTCAEFSTPGTLQIASRARLAPP